MLLLGAHSPPPPPAPPAAKSRNGAAPLRVVAYDYGIKQNILRRLTSFGCKVRAPACLN